MDDEEDPTFLYECYSPTSEAGHMTNQSEEFQEEELQSERLRRE